MSRISALAVLVAILLWPLAVFPVFGLGDTLNHLARMHILATIAKSPELRSHYEVHWAPIPYLAMDAIVPTLALIVPIHVAGRLFVGLCVLMPAASASVLHRAVHGRWSMLPAAGLLIGYTYVLSLGFLNFAFSAGLSVMLFAGWIAARDLPRWQRGLLFCLPVTLLYLGHAFACLGYCLAVAGYEIGKSRRQDLPPGVTIADWAAAAAQAVPALILASRLHLRQAYIGPLFDRYGTLFERVTDLLSPFVFRFSVADCLVLAAALAIGLILRRNLVVSRSLWPAASLVAGASFAIPTVLRSTWGTDLRLPLIASILMLASVSWKVRPTAHVQSALFAALLSMIAIRSGDVAAALRPAMRRIDDARTVLASLPRGSRLLVADADGPRIESDVSLSTKWQIGCLAVLDRDAFVPALFTGMTTVRPVPAMLTSSTPNGLPLSLAQLADGLTTSDGPSPPPDDGRGARVYWQGWPQKFDYVLIQHSRAPYAVPPILVPVGTSPTADLYRVESRRR